MDKDMTNVYQFPVGARTPVTASAQRNEQPGRLASSVLTWLKTALATVMHYVSLTPLLIILRFRWPVGVLSAAYSLNFFFSHGHQLWTAQDSTAVYTTAALLMVALAGSMVRYVERNHPFHRLLSVKGK